MENFFSFVSTWNEIKIWIGSFSWALELSFFPSAVDRDSLKPCITLKIKILVVGFLKKKYKSHFVLFFNADAKIFLRKIKKTKILPTKSWKNHPQKLLRILQIHFFFLTALTAQTAQIEVHIPVPKCGLLTYCI